MRSKSLELYKATLTLTSLQREVLVGLLLGDGHLEHSPSTPRARLKVEQREAAREYVEWLHGIFRKWVLGPVKKKETFLHSTQRSYGKYWFTTVAHEALLPYREFFYSSTGKKRVPRNIAEMLTPRGLAVWFMDDGSVKSHQSLGRIFNTHGFVPEDVHLLCQVLQEKFSLQAQPRVQSDGIQIYISGRSARILQALLEPHVVPMMRYKLPFHSR